MTDRSLVTAVLALCCASTVACGGPGAAPPGTGEPRAAAAEAAPPAVATEAAAPPAARTATAKPLDGRVIVIDPGHNGGNHSRPDLINRKVNVLTQWKACDTTGTATDSGYSEAAFTWDVSRRLAKLLRAKGATVKLTRTSNTGVGPCITRRAAIGNKAGADAAISVHADGAPPGHRGFHVIMPKKIGGPVDPVVAPSRKLGIAIRDAFRAGTGLPYSTYIGHKGLDYRSDLGGLNLSTVPKVFIECGNMRNATEAAKFRQPAFRQRIAAALAAGLEAYLT